MRVARRTCTLAVAVTCAALLGPDALAQDRVPTVTRLVKLFAELESTLDEKLASGDAASARALLTDDFELREARAPGTPIPLTDWLSRLAPQGTSRHVRSGMAVHDYGDIAVVSFEQRQSNRGPATMVVDVWKGSGPDWKLSVRYALATSGASPTTSPPAPKIEKRY